MSKTKTKRARREQKRDASRKIASHQKAANAAAKPSHRFAAPLSKKQKQTKDPKSTAPVSPKAHMQASQKHEVPFGPYDHILLVGEGDFSFTKSLVNEHACANVTATSFDSHEEVRTKYPNFAQTYNELSALTPPVPFHHTIDATKLGSYKLLRSGEERDGGWDTVAFMFPHTGGLSTDVNRQVRANQALLVGFFTSCLSSYKGRPFLRDGGRVMVCLFEGEPYTLWNVRDLARHAGLKVVESYKFEWQDYPGYRHVRTLGSIEGGGAWRGEDRKARMYVFEKVERRKENKDDTQTQRKKRGRDESDSESDAG